MSKSKTGKKVNPKNQPRSQADVDRAFDKGLLMGLKEGEVLLMYTLADKYEQDIDIPSVWQDILKVEHEIAEGRLNLADIRCTLKEEYGMVFDI